MQTISSMPGTGISHSEVTAIGVCGFWLLVDDEEFFVPFDDYPAFRNATVRQVFQFDRLSADQCHWPTLDIDIELDALRNPSRFPLIWTEDQPGR